MYARIPKPSHADLILSSSLDLLKNKSLLIDNFIHREHIESGNTEFLQPIYLQNHESEVFEAPSETSLVKEDIKAHSSPHILSKSSEVLTSNVRENHQRSLTTKGSLYQGPKVFEDTNSRNSEVDDLIKFFSNIRIDSKTAEHYSRTMRDNGFDDILSLEDASDEDLQGMGIKVGHVRRMKRALSMNNISSTPFERKNSSYKNTPLVHQKSAPLTGVFIESGHNLERQERKSDEISGRVWSFDENKDLTVKQNNYLLDNESSPCTAVRMKDRGKRISREEKNPPTKLSREERLQAHRRRKIIENKHKEDSYRWENPPPKQKASLTKKVERKDDLVNRLEANPTERRRQQQLKKQNERLQNNLKYSIGNSDKRDMELQAMAMKSEPVKKAISTATNDRLENNSYARANKNNEFDFQRKSTLTDKIVEEGKCSENTSSIRSKGRIRCETCKLISKCEEDVDNPGTYYCTYCWDEYDKTCDAIETLNSERMVNDLDSKESTKTTTIKTRILSNLPHDEALWFLHDNPQLGDKLLTTGRTMKCWIETKDPRNKDCVRVLLGNIDYSGSLDGAGLDGPEIAQNLFIGTECIRIRDVVGYYIDYKIIDKRKTQDKSVIELTLKGSKGIILTGENAQLSTKDFLENCDGCIDVILDPQCATGEWYPFRESISMRKIAPQFRSKGVGYIRLGDDMSKNGLAFLSSDGCKTFFSSMTSFPDLTSPLTGLQPKTPCCVSKVQRRQTPNKKTPKNNMISKRGHGKLSPKDQRRDNKQSKGSEMDNAKDLLKQLENSGSNIPLKWDAKASIISTLGETISCPSGSQFSGNALTALEDVLSSKNINIFVLRSTIQSITSIGLYLRKDLVSQVSWRTIFVEILKQLKNKRVAPEARKALFNLHGRCFTLANTMELVLQALGLGHSDRPSAVKKGKKSIGKGIDTNKKPANQVEIIEWLAIALTKECEMDGLESTLDINWLEILSRFFISNISHRDQKCRKHVFDGITHIIVYAIKQLSISKENAFMLCGELKKTNPRGWKTIIQRVNMFFLR